MSFRPEPKYKIGDIVDVWNYSGTREGYKITDVQWIWHVKCAEYTWGYKVNEDEHGSTGLTLIYIPERYLSTKEELQVEPQPLRRLSLQAIQEMAEDKLEDAIDEQDYYSTVFEDKSKASAAAEDIVFYSSILELVKEYLDNANNKN